MECLMLMISFYADDSKHIRIIFCTCLVIAPLFSYSLLSPSMYCDISRWSPS